MTQPQGRERQRGLIAFATTAAVVLAIAQLGSYLVHDRLPLGATYAVSGILHLTHIRNTGGVFGMFPGHGGLFAVTSGLTMLLLCLYVMNSVRLEFYQYVCLGIIVAAAAGNVCDRLVYGAVIDFIDIQGIPRWHYIFNIADFSLHVGGWPLVLGTFLDKRRPEVLGA